MAQLSMKPGAMAVVGGARGLRRSKAKVVSIASGKGGVGKTLTTVNMAVATQRMGLRTLIFDGDLGLANVDVVLGLQGHYHIGDVLEGHAALRDIMLTGPLGVRVIPSGSGLARLSRLSRVERLQLLEAIDQHDETFDAIFIDSGAGISPQTLHLNVVADETIVVTTPEPHAMTDAYAFIKVMSEDHGKKRFSLLVNQVRSQEDGLKVSQRISDVARRFLGAEVTMIGSVPVDPVLQRSIMLRQAASENSTHTLAGQEWNKMARELFQDVAAGHFSPTRNFWNDFIHP